jgi:prephenate dehydrogenase
MEEPGFADEDLLAKARVAILGLGLMGGSLALGLHGRCAELVGIDPDPAALQLAAEIGVCDRLAARPETALEGIDLVILAAPVQAILGLLADLPRLHPGSPVVLDLGYTKAGILDAMAALPPRFDPLGGHPMCGKEKSSLAAADPLIFRGRPFAFTRLERTSARACRLADQLARTLEAVPLWLDGETHDRWAAATSHLPYLVACALVAATPLETAPLVGTGFISTTRVAATPSSIMLDVLLTNRANLLAGLQGLRCSLDALEDSLARPDEVELARLLDSAAAQRAAILIRSTGGGS